MTKSFFENPTLQGQVIFQALFLGIVYRTEPDKHEKKISDEWHRENWIVRRDAYHIQVFRGNVIKKSIILVDKEKCFFYGIMGGKRLYSMIVNQPGVEGIF